MHSNASLKCYIAGLRAVQGAGKVNRQKNKNYNPWPIYEAEKRRIDRQNLTPEERDRAIQELARRLKI